MGINPNKRTDGHLGMESVEKTKEMSDSTDELCEFLATKTNRFHSSDFVKKLSIKSTDDINANVVQKYPLVFWSNFVIVFGLILSCWTYYIRRYGHSLEIDNFISEYPSFISMAGFIVIFFIMFWSGKKIYKTWTEHSEEKEVKK